jgi:hypothetical protein
MIRTQVQFTEQQIEALRALAASRDVSIAELVRQSVDQLIRTSDLLSPEEKRRRALDIVGKYHSGQSDISTRHDDYLDEIYGS